MNVRVRGFAELGEPVGTIAKPAYRSIDLRGPRDTGRYYVCMLVAAEVPNTADWMQGWGAVISLPLSLLAVLFTGWLLRHEIRTRRAERADLESRQARLIRVQIDRDLDEDTATYSFIVHNLSTASIYDVRVFSILRGQYAADDGGPLVSQLDSGDQVSTPVRPHWSDNGSRFVPLSPLAGIQFNDADGRALGFGSKTNNLGAGSALACFRTNRPGNS